VKGNSFARRLGAGMGIAVLGAALGGGATWAGAQGAAHTGGTAHGTEVFDALVVTFVPPGSPVTLPATCWMPVTDAYMSVSGNAQFHNTGNKNGFWSTTTFTGTASVQPIVFTTGVPVKQTPTTPTSNTVVTVTPSMSLASGHLTVWDGISVNRRTVVETATLTFKGTEATGAAVSMRGTFHFTFTHVVYTTTGTITFTGSTLQSAHGALTC